MKIGLYFGSFNPIHTGHLIIASHLTNEGSLEKLWFVVSPQNPFKNSASLLNEYSRLHLVQKAIEGDYRFKASDIEFTLPKPSYTSHTLAYLKEKYPQHQFTVIMGSDSFQNIQHWNNWESIVYHFPIMVYVRPGFEVVNTINAQVTILKAPLLEISATHIRQLIQLKKSIKYLVPAIVEQEISLSGFYLTPHKNQKK